MTDFIGEFLDALRAAGFEPKGKIVADDKWHPAFYNGEKKSCSGTYSMKVVDNNFAIGCYFTRKDPDNKFKWHSKTEESFSPEERKKVKKRIEAEQRKREIEEEKKQRRLSRRLTKYCKSLPKTDNHPYLKKKGVQTFSVKIRKKTGEIVIPLFGSDGNVWTLQKINKKGGKYLFAGGRKKGSYFPIGNAKDDLSTILVCEGFATGVSIRQATGLPVIVAVDSGNLTPALVALKSKYPASKFIICADNDAFTKNPKGEPWNVGREAAKKAAQAIGGAYVVYPDFENLDKATYEKEKPTDFNDLHAIAGLDAVKEKILPVAKKIPARQEEPASVDGDSQPSNQHNAGSASEKPKEKKKIIKGNGDYDMNFRVLGYDNGIYYYFPFKERQVVALTANQHSSFPNLFRLDHYDAWLDKFGTADGKTPDRKIITYATNALMELAKNRGVFKEEDRVRGCGAWLDEGRKILHCGDVLYVDGVKTKFEDLKSDYTYIAALKVLQPSKNPLSNSEANKLRQICEKVTWENKLSGSLLAGWLVIAPICGALSFRPHIYINGEAESGKSTVLDSIIKKVLGKISINVDGGTTEPAIRQSMGYDARPLVYDEAEKSNQMPSVLELARKASTGGTVKKFGQGTMKVRFCACFSAINPPVDKASDESRISFMTIKKNRSDTAIEDYNELVAMIDGTLTPGYAARMLARTLGNIEALFKNIEIFQRAARVVIKGARASQVIGTMLAGTYLLSRTDVATPEFAEKWISEHDWSSHTMIEDETDPTRLLQYLSGCIIKVPHSGRTEEYSIGDLIIMANGLDKDKDADKHLRYHGIAVKDDKVHIASRNQYLAKLLKDTDWSVKWTRMLSNLDGAEQFRMLYFSTGCKTSGVSLPIDYFNEDKNPMPPIEKQPELPIEDLEEQEIPF